MGHCEFQKPALGLTFSRTCPDGTRFSFALESPDHLAVDRDVRSPDVSYEGHAWNVVCKRQHGGKFGIEVELVSKNTDSCLKNTVDFTLSIVRRRLGATLGPTCDVKDKEFTKLQPRHGKPDMMTFQDLINPEEGYFSSISPWVELDLVLSKCVYIFEVCDAMIKPVDNGVARVAEFKLSDCRLSVYVDMDNPQKRKICIQGTSQVPNQDYSLQMAYTITQADTVLMSTKLTHIRAPYGNIPNCVISEAAPESMEGESKGTVTVRIKITSFQPATNVCLALPAKTATKGPQRSFLDPLGNCWNMYVQKQKCKISVKLSLSSLFEQSKRNHSHEDCTAVLQWRAWIVPRNRKTVPVPFNDGEEVSESFFKGTSSLLEYTMKSSLEVSQVYGHSNPYRHSKKPTITVRIEYINLQTVPDGKFIMDCESTKMIFLRSELDKLRLDRNSEQNIFNKYRLACKELEQHKERVQHLRMELESQGSEREPCTSLSPSPKPYSLRVQQEDLLPSRNESVRVGVLSEGHKYSTTPIILSSPIKDEIEHETTQIKVLRKEIKKIIETESDSKSRPSSSIQRSPHDIVSVQRLDEVASKLGVEWKSLARQQLGIQQSEIEQCVADNPNSVHEQIFIMLYKWRSREGLQATEGALLAKLKEAKVDFGAILLFHYLLE